MSRITSTTASAISRTSRGGASGMPWATMAASARHGEAELDGAGDEAAPLSGSGDAGAGAGNFFAAGPSTMYGRIAFSWSTDRI